jgi:hypothetical protein
MVTIEEDMKILSFSWYINWTKIGNIMNNPNMTNKVPSTKNTVL